MRVLVTGGAGYIGSQLINRLSACEDIGEVIVFDNLGRRNYNLFFGDPKPGNKTRLVRADILDTRTLRSVLQRIDVVVHLAARVTTPFADENPHLFEQTNHWGTAELVYAIEASPVRKLIYLSSASVYGATSEPVDHRSPTHPKTFYGISKLRGEQHVRRIREAGFDASIVRCGNVFGFGRSMRFDSVINRFLFEANYLGQIAIEGNGNQHRSFVHIDRVVDVLASMTSGQAPPDTYNLVEATWTINTIAQAISQLFPDVDTIFVNQDVEMRELRVARDERLESLYPSPQISLLDHLQQFKSALSFQYVKHEHAT